jgi:hypothetical protein
MINLSFRFYMHNAYYTHPGTKETILQPRQGNAWREEFVLPLDRAGVNFNQGNVVPEIVLQL